LAGNGESRARARPGFLTTHHQQLAGDGDLFSVDIGGEIWCGGTLYRIAAPVLDGPSTYDLSLGELKRAIDECKGAGWQAWEIAARFGAEREDGGDR
jgi:hypothetical protein